MVKSNSLNWIFTVFDWFEIHYISQDLWLGVLSGLWWDFMDLLPTIWTSVYGPYCAYCFLWTFARYTSVISEVCLRKVPFKLCLTVFADSLCTLLICNWILVVFWLTLDMIGVLWCYWGLFWTLWCYFGVFGWTFYAFSQLKGEIGSKTRLEQRNQAKTQAKPKPTAQPGLWARVKAQWATQQCSRAA